MAKLPKFIRDWNDRANDRWVIQIPDVTGRWADLDPTQVVLMARNNGVVIHPWSRRAPLTYVQGVAILRSLVEQSRRLDRPAWNKGNLQLFNIVTGAFVPEAALNFPVPAETHQYLAGMNSAVSAALAPNTPGRTTP